MIPTDITDTDAIAALVEDTSARFGPVDILVDNAGIMLANPMIEGRTDEWQRMIELNLTAVLNLSGALRAEFASSAVRITDIKPGGVDTELAGHISHPALRERIMTAPQRTRLLDPDDVADTIAYAVTRPPHVCLSHLTVMPIGQAR
ncbi:SDR family oxidoreductase [Nocardia sp. BMG111209]|uniref:SDR family oxidoreductase n=1 Tax=Nocardia sp. BMG111209 TaxID=1160137 RepID=UPI00350EDDAF